MGVADWLMMIFAATFTMVMIFAILTYMLRILR